jgi:hypothetical protein
VHIIGDPVDGTSRFFVKPTSGTLSDGTVSYNNSATIPGGLNLEGEPIPSSTIVVNETIFDIPPTSDDLVFAINTISADGKTVATLQTYTIKKTSFYTGSFDVGIFKTWISNPTFTSVNSPTEAGKQALKATNTTPYITATLMYTFYFSPYNALFPGSNGKKYNCWGRSFLDDDGVFLRKIYPALGIGLNGNVMSNWFIGLNCEPMQGLGFFAGRNIRNVNVFNAPVSADLNNLTTDQFNYYQNTKTKSDWAVGLILDVSIFTKLASAISGTK